MCRRVRKVFCLIHFFQGYFLITSSHVIAFLFGSVVAINQVFWFSVVEHFLCAMPSKTTTKNFSRRKHAFIIYNCLSLLQHNPIAIAGRWLNFELSAKIFGCDGRDAIVTPWSSLFLLTRSRSAHQIKVLTNLQQNNGQKKWRILYKVKFISVSISNNNTQLRT